MKKLTKNLFKLIRITIALAVFLIIFILDKTLILNKYLLLALYFSLYFFIGYDVLWRAVRNISHGQIFDENFLMCIATVGAFGIAEYSEAVAVMVFYQLGELFQNYAVGKSRKSISALMDIRPDKAVLWDNGQEKEMLPDEIKIGDKIIVKPGERVPLDGIVISGTTTLDTAALTGESVPRMCKENDVILSGSINLTGVLIIQVEKEFYDSTVSKILDMVENASSKKAKAENFITKFSRYYTPFVVISALFLALIPPIFDGLWLEWFSRALTFLVISCPCALVISIPMAFFGGIGSASKKGILFKGTSYLEMIGKANIFVFDKTGTLTKGRFEVKKVIPENKFNEIISLAAIAEKGSTHPIAVSICERADKIDNDSFEIIEHIGRGIEAKNADCTILCGNARFMIENNIAIIPIEEEGSIVYVAKNQQYVGCIIIADTVRPDALDTIKILKNAGAKTVMLTGDNENYAKSVSEETGIDDYKSNLLPGEKLVELESIIENKSKGDVVVMVGDGINDAPVLVRADLGISMGGIGSDSAVEAADIVLMHDTVSDIITAQKISKRTLKISTQNIVFILLVKAVVLILGAAGIANMWLAVFADVGVAMLAILNSMRALKSI